MARGTKTPPATRTREGVKLSEGRKQRDGLGFRKVLVRTVIMVVVAACVNYVTSWRYEQKKAAYAGQHASPAASESSLPPNCIVRRLL